MKKIQIHIDGANNNEIKKYFNHVNGFTFNPSLFRKLGVKNYIGYTKTLLNLTKKKPLSIEVFADDEKNCLHQAKKISEISKNIYVKIPITYTSGKSTKKLIEKLSQLNIKLNITAIFTLDQIKEIYPVIKNKKHILSIFAGRLYDIGIDASKEFKKMSLFIKKKTKCKSLWASCRMTYDIKTATNSGADIITVPPAYLKKQKLFGMKAKKYSLDTVKGFYLDAKKSGFKIK